MNKYSKNILRLGAVLGVCTLAVYVTAAAAPDYDRIRKDVNVMVGIIKSSFVENKECDKCRVEIKGLYLADQGVIFEVNPRTGSFSDGNRTFVVESIPEIPELVQDIMTKVQVKLEGIEGLDDLRELEGLEGLEALSALGDSNRFEDHAWAWSTDDATGDYGRVARDQLRELRQKQRELEREMREIDIEAIHAEGTQLKELEKREKELASKVTALEGDRDKVQAKLDGYATERRREIEAKAASRKALQQKRNSQIETIVLNTICDYGSTLRNVPSDQRISLVFRNQSDSADIYVLKQSILQGCESGKSDIRNNAMKYVF